MTILEQTEAKIAKIQDEMPDRCGAAEWCIACESVEVLARDLATKLDEFKNYLDSAQTEHLHGWYPVSDLLRTFDEIMADK